MLHEKISINPNYPEVTLTCYVCDNDDYNKKHPRPAVIVCPGGGYTDHSWRESEPVAKKFLGAEMNAFILHYPVGEHARDYAPLISAALAVKYVREHAEEHGTDPHKIIILGFSSGGHLAGSAGVMWNHPAVRQALGVESGKAEEGCGRPDGMILCYPVITSGAYAHRGSFRRLTGKEAPTAEEAAAFSLELLADATTPPAFLWHTFEDTCVPVENSLMYGLALKEKGINFELHIYPKLDHGLALATKETWWGAEHLDNPHVATWFNDSLEFLKIF